MRVREEEFRKWLESKGYGESTVHSTVVAVRRLLGKYGLLKPEDLRRLLWRRGYTGKTRRVYLLRYRKYLEFLESDGNGRR